MVNEVCVNLLKKAHFPEDRLRQLINCYEKYHGADLQRSTFLLHRPRVRYSLSYWTA